MNCFVKESSLKLPLENFGKSSDVRLDLEVVFEEIAEGNIK